MNNGVLGSFVCLTASCHMCSVRCFEDASKDLFDSPDVKSPRFVLLLNVLTQVKILWKISMLVLMPMGIRPHAEVPHLFID